MRLLRFLCTYAVILAIGLIFSCTDNSTNPPTPNTITIKDNFFDPANLTVAVGRPVVWRHQGSNQHTVTSGTPTINPGALFDSGALNPGGGFQFTFTAPGTYPFFCRIHGIAMTG